MKSKKIASDKTSPSKGPFKVVSIKPSNHPETVSGVISYKMIYVSVDGKEVEHPCTDHVWKMIKKQPRVFTHNKKSDFLITVVDGLVTEVVPQERDNNISGFRVAKEDEENVDTRVSFLKRGKTVNLVSAPSSLAVPALEELRVFIKAMASLKVGTSVGDEYIITEVRSTQEGDRVFLEA